MESPFITEEDGLISAKYFIRFDNKFRNGRAATMCWMKLCEIQSEKSFIIPIWRRLLCERGD